MVSKLPYLAAKCPRSGCSAVRDGRVFNLVQCSTLADIISRPTLSADKNDGPYIAALNAVMLSLLEH